MTKSVMFGGLALLATLLVTPTDMRAASLFWSKFPVRTQNESTCMNFAFGVASRQGLQNIRRIPIEVAGTKGDAYVSITCIGRGGGQNAMAIVMVISDAAGTATAVRDQIQRELAKTGCIDQPC